MKKLLLLLLAAMAGVMAWQPELRAEDGKLAEIPEEFKGFWWCAEDGEFMCYNSGHKCTSTGSRFPLTKCDRQPDGYFEVKCGSCGYDVYMKNKGQTLKMGIFGRWDKVPENISKHFGALTKKDLLGTWYCENFGFITFDEENYKIEPCYSKIYNFRNDYREYDKVVAVELFGCMVHAGPERISIVKSEKGFYLMCCEIEMSQLPEFRKITPEEMGKIKADRKGDEAQK